MESKTSLDSLLAWLREEPRTMGWNCILAYDRSKTNTVLLQEYIERFTTGHYLDPITTEIETTDGTLELVYDYIIDAGRLSFENAVISDSMARLTMRIIGGSQISVEEVDGIPHVAKVKSIDALDGPLLYMDIRLEGTIGKITDEGTVFLNLYNAFNVRLTFAATEHERELGGDFFDWYFKSEIPKEQQIHVLNQLKVVPGQFLVPEEFHIRTHAAPGGKDTDSDGHGSGAVLVLVTTKGQDNGEVVVDDKDLPYLIPEGYSATMLLGHEFLMIKIMSEGFRAIASDPEESEYEILKNEAGFIEYLRAVKGKIPATWDGSAKGFVKSNLGGVFGLGELNANFDCMFHDNRFILHWEGTADLNVFLETDDSFVSTTPMTVGWMLVRPYEFRVNAAAGTVNLVPVLFGGMYTVLLLPGDNLNFPQIMSRFPDLKRAAEPGLRELLLTTMDKFIEPVLSIDLFRVNSLLFRGDNVVQLRNAFVPGDMLTIGDVSPSLNRFAITPLESDIGPAQQTTFKTVPEMPGVIWSVEKVPGSSDAIGSIDSKGVYTAPPLSQITGSYTRIRVTATLGEYRQSALINVVTRDINLNPMVMTCPIQTATGREMSAGVLGGGKLTWSIVDPDSGATIEPSSIPFGDHVYYPGPKLEDAHVTVDEVLVTSEKGARQICPVVVVHNTGTLIVEYEETGNPDTLQMRGRYQGNLLPITEPFEWKVIAGSGRIDATTGLFTLDPEGQHKFAVITAVVDWAPGWEVRGFVILPVPLLPRSEAMRVQRICQQRQSANK